MNMTFEEIVIINDLNLERILELENTIKDIKKNDSKYNELEKMEIGIEYSKAIEKINKFYFEKIFKENFCLSIEDIAKHLDLSIRFIMNDIINKLDRIEFPNSEFEIKKIIKSNLYYELNSSKKEILGVTITDELKEKFKELYRKKVLYSKNSYIKFLEEHMDLVEDNLLIKLEIDKNWIKEIRVKLKIDEKRKDYIIIESLFKKFLEKNKKEIEKYKANEIFDFKFLVERRFNIENLKKDRELTDFKSINSLKVLFDKTYDLEVLREIKKAPNDFEFNLNLGGKKKIKRYILNSNFIIDKMKENFNLNSNKNNESEVYEVKIPRSYYYKKYGNTDKVVNEFKKFSERVKSI